MAGSRTRWLWGTAVATAAGTLVLGVGEFVLLPLAAAGVVQLAIGPDARRRALRRLARLPFSLVETGVRGGAIRKVMVRTRATLDGDEAGAVAKAVPGLTAQVVDGALEVTGWQWGKGDLVQLDALIATWALELHRTHLIAEMAIAWDG